MKKVIRLFFLATILTFFTVIITSCNSSINSPINENDVSNVSFDEISKMAYIGGSLVFIIREIWVMVKFIMVRRLALEPVRWNLIIKL